MYVFYTKEFPLGGPDSPVVQTTPPPSSPRDCIMLLEYFITYTFCGFLAGVVEGSLHLVYGAGLYLNRTVYFVINIW